jgi:cation transporter-like permease
MQTLIPLAVGGFVGWVVYHVNVQRGYNDRVGWFFLAGIAAGVLVSLVLPTTAGDLDRSEDCGGVASIHGSASDC